MRKNFRRGLIDPEILFLLTIIAISVSIISSFLLEEGHFFFACSSKSDQQLIKEIQSSDPEIRFKAISLLIKRNNPVAKNPQTIDYLVISSVNLLDENGKWLNVRKGRKFYDLLKKIEPDLVVSSLVRQIFKPKIRLRVLFLTIKLGIPGSEEKLIAVLNQDGDKKMAEDFLNSGSEKLHQAGVEWARKNGYMVSFGSGSHRAFWGRF